MKSTKSSARHALIHYISSCYHDQAWASLDLLQVSRPQAQQISQLSTFECNTLSNLSGCFTTFRIRFGSLKRCVADIQQKNSSTVTSSESRKEVDLCLYLCNHVAVLYRNNQRLELKRLGLSPQQAGFISDMPARLAQSLSYYFWQFVAVTIDPQRLDLAVESAISTSRWIQQCIQLIRAGAPRDLMIRYYGMSCELYAEAREMHGKNQRGRPKVLPYEEQHQLYDAFVRHYQRYEEAQADPLRQPTFFLDLYDVLEQRVSLREIWSLVQDWVQSDLVDKRVGRRTTPQ